MFYSFCKYELSINIALPNLDTVLSNSELICLPIQIRPMNRQNGGKFSHPIKTENPVIQEYT